MKDQYKNKIEEKDFADSYLAYIQISRKKHLIDFVNSRLPLVLVENFHVTQKLSNGKTQPRKNFLFNQNYNLKYFETLNKARGGFFFHYLY